MGYIGRVFKAHRVVCGGLVLVAAAPAAHAAPLPLAGHPIGVTAAACELSARVQPRPYRRFDVEADRANCVGMIATRTLQPESIARISGRAVPNGMCGWKIRNGRLALSVTTLELDRAWMTIAMPFPTRDASIAAPLAGTSRASGDRVSYSGVITLAPEVATQRTPPRCGAVADRAIKVSIQLALSTPAEGQGS